ncbi:MAG TPA: hypothetical protein VF855_14620 [Acidimicrobiales bacterium]
MRTLDSVLVGPSATWSFEKVRSWRSTRLDALRDAVQLSPVASFRTFRLGQWVDGQKCGLGEDGRAVWGVLLASPQR